MNAQTGKREISVKAPQGRDVGWLSANNKQLLTTTVKNSSNYEADSGEWYDGVGAAVSYRIVDWGYSKLTEYWNDKNPEGLNDRFDDKFDDSKQINSLNLEMIFNLKDKLNLWEKDNNIKSVIIKGIGRAFCAGGDIKSEYVSPISKSIISKKIM